MECIYGKHTWSMDAGQYRAMISGFREILLDLGTGDGRFVIAQVTGQPGMFGIGLDTCRENLHEASRRENARTLFVIANAMDLPVELAGTVTLLTINFPWGSLLKGLLSGEEGVMRSLAFVCAKGARVEVRLNESAVRKTGFGLREAGEKVNLELGRAGFQIRTWETIDCRQLKSFPTTWARRMAYGRAPQGVLLRGAARYD